MSRALSGTGGVLKQRGWEERRVEGGGGGGVMLPNRGLGIRQSKGSGKRLSST